MTGMGSHQSAPDFGFSGEQRQKNPFTKCRQHALESADNGAGIQACPYPKNPYKSHWLRVYWERAQLDLFIEEAET